MTCSTMNFSYLSSLNLACVSHTTVMRTYFWATRGWWAHTPPRDVQLSYAGPLGLGQQLCILQNHAEGGWSRRIPLQCLERTRPIPGRERKRLKNLAMVLRDICCDMHMVLVLLVRDRPAGRMVGLLCTYTCSSCLAFNRYVRSWMWDGRSTSLKSSVPWDAKNSYFYMVRHRAAFIKRNLKS